MEKDPSARDLLMPSDLNCLNSPVFKLDMEDNWIMTK